MAHPSRPPIHCPVSDMITLAPSTRAGMTVRSWRTCSAVLAASVLLASQGVTQVASRVPAQPPPKPTLRELGMVIYPSKKQSPAQQAKDEAACYAWAESQSGISLQGGSLNTEAAGRAAGEQAARKTEGAEAKGAGKGALAGVAIGAIAGNAGAGAAIGAIAGAMGGRAARKRATQQAEAQGAQQATAQNQEMVNQFKKAAAVCLEGRGYNAK